MANPDSASTPYATVDDLLARFDIRFAEQICSDTDAPLTAQQLQTSPRMLVALSDAAGAIEAAVFTAGRMTPAELQTLTGNSASLLVWLNAWLAIANLFMARPSFGPPPAMASQAQQILAKLEKGEWTFGLDQNATAGQFNEYVDSAADINALDLPTVQAQNLFGIRANRTNVSGGFSTF